MNVRGEISSIRNHDFMPSTMNILLLLGAKRPNGASMKYEKGATIGGIMVNHVLSTVKGGVTKQAHDGE